MPAATIDTQAWRTSGFRSRSSRAAARSPPPSPPSPPPRRSTRFTGAAITSSDGLYEIRVHFTATSKPSWSRASRSACACELFPEPSSPEKLTTGPVLGRAVTLRQARRRAAAAPAVASSSRIASARVATGIGAPVACARASASRAFRDPRPPLPVEPAVPNRPPRRDQQDVVGSRPDEAPEALHGECVLVERVELARREAEAHRRGNFERLDRAAGEARPLPAAPEEAGMRESVLERRDLRRPDYQVQVASLRRQRAEDERRRRQERVDELRRGHRAAFRTARAARCRA